MSEALLKKAIKEMVQKEVERIVPPETTILLDDIARGIQQILNVLSQQVPKGITFQKERTVTFDKPWKCGFVNSKPYHLLHRVEIINEGPDSVHVQVEIKDEESPYEITVENRRHIPVDVKRPAIKRVFFYVDKDKTANVKVIGMY